MSAPLHEPEIGLRELGCPYGADDPRALVWLAGYRKGHAAAHELAMQSLDRIGAK